MNDEFNSYNIQNPDGVAGQSVEQTSSYSNDDPFAYRENALDTQSEWGEATEWSDAAPASDASGSSSGGNASGTRTTVSTTLTSTLSGGLGAIAGTVATTVVTAVIVVATYINMMTVNLSLVMADMYRLVLQVDIAGASDEDFETPLIATLEGNGRRLQQDVMSDTRYLTFEDLEADTQYVVRIQSGEKLYAEKTFCTAAQPQERGFLEAFYEHGEVYAYVWEIVLAKDEFYTITAWDAKGKKVFVADSVDPQGEFRFAAPQTPALYLTLSVGSTVCAVTQLFLEKPYPDDPEPWEDVSYDYNSATWTWRQDCTAYMTVPEVHGGDPLVVKADVIQEVTEPTCTEDGYTHYIATVSWQDKSYQDELIIPYANTATGHEYGDEPAFEWTQSSGGDMTVSATFTCVHDDTHTLVYDVTDVSYEEALPSCDVAGTRTYYATLIVDGKEYNAEHVVELAATGHDYQLIQAVEATCTEDGHLAYYVCSVCERTFDMDYNEISVEDVVLTGGHQYGEPIFQWLYVDEEYTATAYVVCARDPDHTVTLSAMVEVTEETDDYVLYTATADFEGTYSVEKKVYRPRLGDEIEVGIGQNYYVGDFLVIGGDPVWFRVDDDEQPYRYGMGTIEVLGILEHYAPSYVDIYVDGAWCALATATPPDYALEGAAVGTLPIQSVSDLRLVGFTIAAGDGSAESPYVLSALYGTAVRFYAQGELVYTQYFSAAEVSEGAKAHPAAIDPVRTGYAFDGWYTDAGMTTRYDFDTPVTQAIDLYAGWVQVAAPVSSGD